MILCVVVGLFTVVGFGIGWRRYIAPAIERRQWLREYKRQRAIELAAMQRAEKRTVSIQGVRMMRPAEMPKRTLEDALYTLSIEKEMPDAALLDEVIRVYPEFSEELTDFAIDLAVDRCANRMREEEAIPSAAELQNVSPAVRRALSRFQNCLHSRSPPAAAAPLRHARLPGALPGGRCG